ncbi:MAG: hypothetical protein NC824_04080, partial [Candidatus Omnitrophica bacterium]|nr:hypothetical protein [Candidatus Omnitrophota bacterium]
MGTELKEEGKMETQNKRCPKCNEEIPSHWYFHKKCGWQETAPIAQNEASVPLEETQLTEQNKESTAHETGGAKQLIEEAERIGTIGSPSTTNKLSLNVLATAAEKKLVGELAFFRFPQDNKPHYALGQITEIQLRNIWLEDPTIKSLARQRGQVNPVSGQQDTHIGDITVSAVFCNDGNSFEPGILGTVPATGT